MKRSRTSSDTRIDSAGNTPTAARRGESMEILHNIASFLTLSDAASLYSFPNSDGAYEDEEELSIDSWAIGEGYDAPSCGSALWDLRTPATPGLVALSPGATPRLEYDCPENNEIADDEELNSQEETEYMNMILQEKRRRWAQQKLAAAVFAHPGSLRSFCLDAYQTAVEIRHRQEQSTTPELDVPQPVQRKMSARRTRRRMIINSIIDFVFHNLPVSVLIDVIEAVGEVSLDTTFASYRLTTKTMNAIVRALVHVVTTVWECIINFNPFQLLETVVSFQFNAMEKTSEALATGIQSVATGMGSAMGSASSMALHRLSNANLSANKSASTGSLLHDSGLRRPRTNGLGLNKKLLKKLSSINDAARVVSYMESGDITGGLR
eukprot:scaffold34597_cov177-Amphora_coffeaeformis.AAC.1